MYLSNIHTNIQQYCTICTVEDLLDKRVVVSRNKCLFQLVPWENFFDIDFVLKNKKMWNVKWNVKCGLTWSVLLSTSTHHHSFPKTFYCFCMSSEFAKVFERKVWLVIVAHLHNAACALSIFLLTTSMCHHSCQNWLTQNCHSPLSHNKSLISYLYFDSSYRLVKIRHNS